jgi:thiamine biosynthesis lipoprotein
MSAAPDTARWRALGSTAVVRVADSAQLEAAVLSVERTLADFDRACSRFREDSEISLLNARAGRPVEVSPLMRDAVELALRGAELTGGLLDPCLGRSLVQAGYDRDWELVRERPEEQAEPLEPLLARRRRPWREIEVDDAAGTVRIPAGTMLDLGATAKALAADRACATVHCRFGHGVLVALGGDLAVRGETPVGGWPVHVTDDHRSSADAPGQRISIEAGGLATSSTTTRRWQRAGQTMHHIIDPATGRPADTRWRTVSVAAGDCSDANVASTAALLHDADAPEWLESLGLPARLVERDGSVRTVAGWPAERSPAAEAAL